MLPPPPLFLSPAAFSQSVDNGVLQTLGLQLPLSQQSSSAIPQERNSLPAQACPPSTAHAPPTTDHDRNNDEEASSIQAES